MKYIRIKALREDGDFTQKELAAALKITRSAYSNYENGLREIPPEVLAGIARFYSTSVDYLIGLTDERQPYPRKSS